jgi:hypothetical protein
MGTKTTSTRLSAAAAAADSPLLWRHKLNLKAKFESVAS